MDSLNLAARPRHETGRHVHALRREGAVPAVLYGHKVAAVSLAIDAKELDRVWQKAGRTHLVDLKVEGQKSTKALIRDLQFHPRSGRPLHVDFFAVNLREKLQADVPVVVTGDSAAVERKEGQVQQVMTSLRVECLPGDLPAQITVDVSGLEEVDQSILLGAVPLPKGVTLAHADENEVVVKIAAVRVREEAEPAAAEGEAAEETPVGAAAEGAEEPAAGS